MKIKKKAICPFVSYSINSIPESYQINSKQKIIIFHNIECISNCYQTFKDINSHEIYNKN